ncbi:unnamed protein product [Lactuca virosa]|uniref:Uncharacterized protein n=1 Tax=Lactuca virosa TaxID=75947 RepID=A0AAU9NVY7_9ASTR|nr:unnamed protein product [Lactuca virosa]
MGFVRIAQAQAQTQTRPRRKRADGIDTGQNCFWDLPTSITLIILQYPFLLPPPTTNGAKNRGFQLESIGLQRRLQPLQSFPTD